MKANLSIHMYARASKSNTIGHYPIYVRITIGGQRTEFSTRKFVDPKKWDANAMRIKGNTEEARTTNSHLDNIRLQINQNYLKLSLQGQEVTIENLIESYQGKREKARMLVPIFKNHNQKIKELIGQEYAAGTYQRYQITLNHVQKFLRWKNETSDIDIKDINNMLIHDFDFYLRSQHKCANNTVMKYIKNLKKVVQICVANGWIDKDPFLNYKVKLHEVERHVLTEDELTKMIEKEITIERLDLVRDIFLFSCYTGLAYIDVKQLRKTNIIKGIDGQQWISTHRQKTDTPSKIPLLETPASIIHKYADHPKSSNEGNLLPILSNQKMNAYLKELADICGIHKTLTFHCARHTFATTVTLSNGVPIESVSKMLGHKSIKTTQHYAKITDKKVAHDMQHLRETLDKTERKIKIS